MENLALSISGTPIPLPGGAKNYDLSNIISTAVSLLILFAILLTLFFLISGGLDMIMANGEKEKVAKSREKLTYAVFGLIIVFLSFLIVGTIGDLFGVKLLAPRL